MSSELKRCSRCKESRPRSEFGAKAATSDGLHSWCLECAREYGRQWRAGNPAKVLALDAKRRDAKVAYMREYNARPEVKERNRQSARERYRESPRKETDRAKNAAQMRKRRRELKEKDPGKLRTHAAWSNMRQRCQNPSHPRFPGYGGRGITVCERWDSFDVFLADMGRCPEGLTLERIDNEGGYDPGNCCWATWEAQRANQRPRAA